MIWDFDPVLVQFMGIKIHYYGVIFAIGIYIGYLLWRWQMLKHGYSEKDSEDFVLWGFLAVILGSRLGHCLFYDPQYYFSHPIEIIKFWKGGLASHGASIALLVTLYCYHRIKKIGLWQICDCFSMSAAVGATAVRIGNFLNSEIVGRVTDVPWGLRFVRFEDNAPIRHPSQLYEVALGITVLLVLIFVDRHYRTKRPVGMLSSLFLSVYFTGRFLVEYFKEYQVLPNSFPFTMGQLLSVPFALFGFYLFYLARCRKLGEVEQVVVLPPPLADNPTQPNVHTTDKNTGKQKRNKKKKH